MKELKEEKKKKDKEEEEEEERNRKESEENKMKQKKEKKVKTEMKNRRSRNQRRRKSLQTSGSGFIERKGATMTRRWRRLLVIQLSLVNSSLFLPPFSINPPSAFLSLLPVSLVPCLLIPALHSSSHPSLISLNPSSFDLPSSLLPPWKSKYSYIFFLLLSKYENKHDI